MREGIQKLGSFDFGSSLLSPPSFPSEEVGGVEAGEAGEGGEGVRVGRVVISYRKYVKDQVM